MSVRKIVLLFAVVAGGVSIRAGLARSQAGRDACAADVEKFCKDVPVGGGRRYKCLKEHEKELSEPCRKHIADVQTRVRGVREACWDDVGRFRQDVPRERGRVLACLKAHEAELSDPCKAALQPAQAPGGK